MNVLIVRTRDKLKETSDFFTKAGYSTIECQISKTLPTPVKIPDNTDGFIITSSCALLSIKHQNIPLFCVGDITGLKATDMGFRVIYSGNEGAQNLAEYIANVYPPQKLVHAAGDNVSNDWYKTLENKGFEIVYSQAYSTEYSEDISEDVVSAIKNGTIDAIIFLSAMGAKTFVSIANKYNLAISNIAAVAISKIVADNLQGMQNIKIADQANMEGISKCLGIMAINNKE